MASGDLLATLWPRASLPPTTVFATHDVLTDGSTVVGVVPVLDFKGADNDTNADWQWTMPDHYDGGGITVTIEYAMAGTDGDDVQFEVRTTVLGAEAPASDDLGGATGTDITDTPNGTANVKDTTPAGTISHSNASSPAVGAHMRTRITRDYDHAANTDDAQFIRAVIHEV